MRVLTLNKETYIQHVDRLAVDINRAGLTSADMAVVGVLNSGAIVARDLVKALGWKDAPYFEVELHRATTKAKDAAGLSFLRHLPLCLLNAMRIIEARMLRYAKRKKGGSVNIPSELGEIAQSDSKVILIVDDAIDSGHTIHSICEAIRACNHNVRIKIAAITTTTPDPAVTADFCLYNNQTLIRFPWARDAKQ